MRTDSLLRSCGLFFIFAMSPGSSRASEPKAYFYIDGWREPLPLQQESTHNNAQWNLQNLGGFEIRNKPARARADVNILPVWERGWFGSEQVVVAVIDTGVDVQHSDLSKNIFINEKEIPGNGIDDDGNGFVDDVSGWNFVDNNEKVFDENGHGTHVAGIVGASGGEYFIQDSLGISGINRDVRILPIKAFRADGSSSSDLIVPAIQYAVRMGASVISSSWSGSLPSESVRQEIEIAGEKGVLFVTSSGNRGVDIDQHPVYPASFELENIIVVSASDHRDQIVSGVSYGAGSVDLFAPGYHILSTVPGGAYERFTGTSMAVPHVSGAIALLQAQGIFGDTNRLETSLRIKNTLLRASDHNRYFHLKARAGRLNINDALEQVEKKNPFPKENQWKKSEVNIESEHPYANNFNVQHEFKVPGAKFVRLRFGRVDTELNHDQLTIRNGQTGQVLDSLFGSSNGVVSEFIEGNLLLLEFTSDASVVDWGYEVRWVEYVD